MASCEFLLLTRGEEQKYHLSEPSLETLRYLQEYSPFELKLTLSMMMILRLNTQYKKRKKILPIPFVTKKNNDLIPRFPPDPDTNTFKYLEPTFLDGSLDQLVRIESQTRTEEFVCFDDQQLMSCSKAYKWNNKSVNAQIIEK